MRCALGGGFRFRRPEENWRHPFAKFTRFGAVIKPKFEKCSELPPEDFFEVYESGLGTGSGSPYKSRTHQAEYRRSLVPFKPRHIVNRRNPANRVGGYRRRLLPNPRV